MSTVKNIVLNCHSDNINYCKTDVSSCLRYNLHSVNKITVFPCDLKRIHCICLVIITNRDNTLINISYDHLANSSVHSLTTHTHTSNDTHTANERNAFCSKQEIQGTQFCFPSIFKTSIWKNPR